MLTWAGLTVLIAYGLAFMYVVIIGTYTERSEFNKIVGNTMLDEFYIAIAFVFVYRLLNSLYRSFQTWSEVRQSKELH